jgi:hypothetical protein
MSPQWNNDYFREAGSDASQPGRGLVGHVPIIATLLIVQGILEFCLGAFFSAFAALTFVLPAEALAGISSSGLIILMAVIGVLGIVCGALRVAAGLYNWSYRRRTLGITALGVGLATILTGYCAPTAIALAIYGLIVYVNESVVSAFELGTQGRSKAEIQAAFPVDR